VFYKYEVMAIEKFKGKNGQYYFRVKAANGQIVLQSEGYLNQSGVDNGVSFIRGNAKEDSFELRKSRSGDSYFVIKARNGRVIGRSEMYKSESGAKRGIESVVNTVKGETVNT